jgi:2-(1,2-epoxy-1,2-dihydrophenyl)acetyl-CoA isomerase
MTDDSILTQVDEHGVATVTLNRPQAKNSFTTAMQTRMIQTFHDLARDPGVRVVILTGAGDAFCTGGDVKALGAADLTDPIAQKWASESVWMDAEARFDRLNVFVRASLLLHRMGKPTIAMIRGAVAGAGVSLALACDFRIVARSAFWVTSFTRIGMSGDFGVSYFLTKLLGPSKAMEMLMLSDRVDAEQAQALGLVTRLVDDGALLTEAQAFARRLAAGPPVALRYIKENVQAALDEPLDRAIAIETRNMVRTRLTQDSKEAMTAFAEKRDANFQGY